MPVVRLLEGKSTVAKSGRPQSPRTGTEVANHPDGFPSFFGKRQTRIITADPWSFLNHVVAKQLPSSKEAVALAYIAQAKDFFEAAEQPRLGSKPLLYYYSFLNLAKAALITKGVPLPAKVQHGISDPKANVRSRLRMSGQKVNVNGCAHDRSELYPEFVKILGGTTAKSYRVVDLLAQVPVIHRTFNQVSGEPPSLLPMKSIAVMRSKGLVWCRIALDTADRDVAQVLPVVRGRAAFRRVFHQVSSATAGQLWFETEPEVGHAVSIDPAIGRLADTVRQAGASFILTRHGYRHYLSALPPRIQLPDLAAILAVAFYFGSVVRYKPDVFAKIVDGGYAWVVHEFFAAAPNQFLYGLSSFLAGVDVIRPFGTAE